VLRVEVRAGTGRSPVAQKLEHGDLLEVCQHLRPPARPFQHLDHAGIV
jgi:hypothetical protein